MTRPFAIAMAIMIWGAVAPVATAQQDAKELLKEAYDFVERGRNAEALEKINAVLATDPSSDEAYALRNVLQSDQWVQMSIQNDQLDAAVKEIFGRARPAALAQTADAEAIKKLIEEARAGDFQAQRHALRQLRANHGDYAVAYLWQDLGNADTERRISAMAWMRELGSDAPLPLIQVLEAPEPLVRANAAALLGVIRDDRALPYVAHLAASDSDQTVREAAAAAAAKFGGGNVPVAALYLDLAERFYRRDHAAVKPYRAVYPVWSFSAEGDEAGLVAREVPRELYHLKLAEEVLYDLLAIEPNSEDGQVLLASVLIAQAEFGRDLPAEGEDAAVAAATTEAGRLAAAQGASILHRVVRKAAADGRSDVAEGAVRILAAMLDQNSFGGSNGLTAGLMSPFKAARFGAALAIARISPRTDFEGRDRVVPSLIEALGHDAVRNVLVIDDVSASREKIISDLNGRHYFAVGAATGASGVARLREYPIEDLVIVRYGLSTAPHVSEVVRAVRGDPRTETTPIAMIVEAAEEEQAKTLYGDKVQLFIKSPPDVDAYEPEVKPLVAGVDASRERATLTAAEAAKALESMDPQGSVLASASAVGGLVDSLKGDDRVRGPAIRALGKIGDPSATAALIDVVKTAGNAEALRADAYVALARISRTSGATSPETLEALREAWGAEGSPEFKAAVSLAAGIAPMSYKDCVDLLRSGRARAQMDQVK